MTNIRHLSVLPILLLTAATAAPAYASSGAPPLKGGVHCHQRLKKSYRLKSVIKHGMPIKVSCDGPARFFSQPEFVANTRQDRDLTVLGGHTTLMVGIAKETGMSQAGTVSYRPRLTKVAIRVIKRYKRTKLESGLGTLRADGYFWSDPGDWGHTVIVR